MQGQLTVPWSRQPDMGEVDQIFRGLQVRAVEVFGIPLFVSICKGWGPR